MLITAGDPDAIGRAGGARSPCRCRVAASRPGVPGGARDERARRLHDDRTCSKPIRTRRWSRRRQRPDSSWSTTPSGDRGARQHRPARRRRHRRHRRHGLSGEAIDDAAGRHAPTSSSAEVAASPEPITGVGPMHVDLARAGGSRNPSPTGSRPAPDGPASTPCDEPMQHGAASRRRGCARSTGGGRFQRDDRLDDVGRPTSTATDGRLGRVDVPGSVGAAGPRWAADLPQRRMPFAGAGARGPRRQPDRRVPAVVHRAGGVAKAPHASCGSARPTRWASCGSTDGSSGSARTAASRRRTTSPALLRRQRQGVHRRARVERASRGSRTRTSGGCPASTAASSSCRCHRPASPTRRPCPGLDADGTTGTPDASTSRVDDADGASSEALIPSRSIVGSPPARPRRSRRRCRVARCRAGRPGDAASTCSATAGRGAPGARAELRRAGHRAVVPRAPGRYRVVVVLRDADGEVLDVRARWVGFRRVEVADRALLINGQPVVINGVNHHENHPDRGRVVSDRRHPARPRADEAHHVNAVRTRTTPTTSRSTTSATSSACTSSTRPTSRPTAGGAALADDPRVLRARIVERGAADGAARPLPPVRHRLVARQRVGLRAGPRRHGGVRSAASTRRVRCTTRVRSCHDLDAASPVSDIVCPMYAPVDGIVRWSRAGRDGGAADPVRVQPRDGPGRRRSPTTGRCSGPSRAAGRVRVGVGRPRDAPPRRRRHSWSRTAATSASGDARRQLRAATGWSRPTGCRTRCWPSWRRWPSRCAVERLDDGRLRIDEPPLVHRPRRPGAGGSWRSTASGRRRSTAGPPSRAARRPSPHPVSGCAAVAGRTR